MKVLVIRFSSLGDIILTSPIVRILKQNVGADVHYLTKDSFSGLLIPNPHISKVWTIKKSVNKVAKALKEEKYDHIIDLHLNLRSLQVKLLLRNANKTSFIKNNLSKWKMVHLKKFPNNPTHIVDRYLTAIAPLGAFNDDSGLDFYFDPNLNTAPINSQIPNTDYGVFVIGAAHFTKIMPKEKFVEVMEHFNFPIVIIGGPDEMAAGSWITDKIQKPVVNLCGKLSLQESAWVVREAKIVIAHDTGFMHIAAALKKPIISIWGGSVPEMGYWPYYGSHPIPHIMIQNKQLNCRPCSRFGKGYCPKKHFNCMNNLSPLLIANSANQMMEKK